MEVNTASVIYKFLHGSNLFYCINLFVINKSTITIVFYKVVQVVTMSLGISLHV